MESKEKKFEMTMDPTTILNMSREKIRENFDKMERIPCPEYNGIKWPSFPSFRMKGVENAIKAIIDFETRDTDIILCTHSKSGTHWAYEVIKMLLISTTELTKEPKANTMLEALIDLNSLNSLPSPRILDTHFMFQYLPRKHVEERRKIVHMMRNPKDVLVSFYYHAQKDKVFNVNVPWNDLFETWMEGNMPYGTWYDYELGIEQAEKNYPGMIYTCYYEDMKEYPEKEIRKLAKFLELNPSDELITSIAHATSFDNMQKNKFDITSLIYDKGFIFRKGQVGDWKNHFTVAQNERFDAQFKDKMKNSNYKFRFE